MNKRSKNFNNQSRESLRDVISRLSGLEESLKEKSINLLNEKEIYIFGYGSIVTKPHDEDNLTSITTAYLWDYSRDMCCKSVVSGTHKKTGLTLGLDKKEGAIVPGAILSYKNLNSNQLVTMLEKFADREVVTALPIYKFAFLEVEKEDGTMVHAITCIADTKQLTGYAGDMLTDFDKASLPSKALEDLSLRKKAHEIAWANGTTRKSGKYATGKSYFDRFVRLPIEDKLITKEPDATSQRDFALYQEQQHMLKLAKYIDEERQNMRKTVPDYVIALEKREAEQLMAWKQSPTYQKQNPTKGFGKNHK